MKVKNLIIGNIAKIEHQRISMEEYYPSASDDIGNFPVQQEQSLFYKVGNHAIDLVHIGCYKLVKAQEKYPDKLRDKKVVIFEKPFGALTVRNNISRSDAVLVYQNRRVK